MRPSAYKNTGLHPSQKFQKPLRRVAILHAKLQLFFEIRKKNQKSCQKNLPEGVTTIPL